MTTTTTKDASTALFSRVGTVQRIRNSVSESKDSVGMARESWEKSAMMETKSNQSTDALGSALFRLGTFAMEGWEKDPSVLGL